MKIVKKYLLFSILFFFYLTALSLVIQQFFLYQRAYYALSSFIANPSLVVVEDIVRKQNTMEEKKE